MFHALFRQDFGTDRGIEHFHRNPLVIPTPDELGGDGWEIHIAHARAAEVGIVGVEMRSPWQGITDDLWDGFGIGRHRFHVEMEPDVRRSDFF